MLHRTTLKLSTDLSNDEIAKAISETVGIPYELLPHINFEVEIAKINNERSRISELTKDYKARLDSDLKIEKGKYEELDDLGRFILGLNQDYKIFTPKEIPKYPDFILLKDDVKIGVEHTRLMSKQSKTIFQIVKYCIKKAEELIPNELNNHSKTINIFFDLSVYPFVKSNSRVRNLNKEQKLNVAKIIADYIKSKLTGGSVPKPDFISKIKITSNKDSRVDLEFAESYFTSPQIENLLINRIQDKEIKANKYRMVNPLSELWLLIVADDIKSYSGFDLEFSDLPALTKSDFDQIFLFEKYSGKIYTLFKT